MKSPEDAKVFRQNSLIHDFVLVTAGVTFWRIV
jgi:hypothetical protein